MSVFVCLLPNHFIRRYEPCGRCSTQTMRLEVTDGFASIQTFVRLIVRRSFVARLST